MKLRFLTLLLLVSAFIVSCNDDVTDMGSSIQPSGDKLMVYDSVFSLSSESYVVPYVYDNYPDSFLLGTYYDEIYGSTNADILAQLQAPIGVAYPSGAVPDSAVIHLYYQSWAGDDFSPIEISVYEMNKGTIAYPISYPTNINPLDYCDMTSDLLLAKKTFTARDAVIAREDSSVVSIKLSDDFVKNRFAFNLSRVFTNKQDFLDLFKGLYITPKFGSAAMMNIYSINLVYYFHYKYKYSGDADSTTVNTYIKYPANDEVRQLNRFTHPDTTAIKQRLQLPAYAGVNYISAPANIYTRVKIPLKSMVAGMNMGNKKLIINSALLRVDVVDDDDSDFLVQNPISSLMIIKESDLSDFFKNRELPTDTTAVVASYSSETDSDTEVTSYYYSYDLATYLSYEIAKAKKYNTELPDELSLVLVPVSLTYNTSGTVTKVKPLTQLNSITIRSAANSDNPMRLKMVYSGF